MRRCARRRIEEPHLNLDPASNTITAPLLPSGATEALGGAQDILTIWRGRCAGWDTHGPQPLLPWARIRKTGFVSLYLMAQIHVCIPAGYTIRMSKPVPVFGTMNWSRYNQALKRRGSLMVWFDADMPWFACPSGKVGHPERFSATAIQFCLSIKVLLGCRRARRQGS